MRVTQLPVGGLQWLGMQTISLEQILSSQLSHTPAKTDTGMATYPFGAPMLILSFKPIELAQ